MDEHLSRGGKNKYELIYMYSSKIVRVECGVCVPLRLANILDISNQLLINTISCFPFVRCVLYLLRFLVTLMVLLIYVGSGVAIYFTVDWVTECPSVEKREDVDDGK